MKKYSIKTYVVATKERPYKIYFGSDIVSKANIILDKYIKHKSIVIIYDKALIQKLKPLEISVSKVASNITSIGVNSGENSKSFNNLNFLCEKIIESGIDRKSILIAFGGGVIGDLTGFVASILLRGINFIQIPTTMLAQVDSSIGGKTGINSIFGKNLIGSFHQPIAVLSDTKILDSLDSREILSGYAEIIKQRSNLRRLISTAENISSLARESDSSKSEQLLDDAEERILSLRDDAQRSSGPKVIRDLLGEVYGKIQESNETGDSLVGVSTGFTDIDEVTLGFQKSDLIIIAARPSMGKSALAFNIAENVARQTDQTVVIFSMEMSAEQIVRRFISSIAKIDLQRLLRGQMQDSDWEGIDKALTILSKKNILLDDTPALTPSELRARARRVKRENKDLAMIVVDYIGLMQVHGRADNRVAEISEISRSLKALAKELDVPVLALSQLNRAVESRPNKRPMLADLRDSGAIEQDADVIGFIYRHEYYDRNDLESKGKAEINIAKQRNGPTKTISLAFRDSVAKFENLAKEERFPPQYYDQDQE